jgi:hypothetical protein
LAGISSKSTILLSFLPLAACARGGADPRSIRAHTHLVDGISHANPLDKAERYCSYCHGAALQGGEHYEPSCYQCHGKNWLQSEASAAVSTAPADHSLVEGGRYKHKPTLFTPVGDCDACHGAQLEGTAGYPACTLCHTQLWLERTAP